MRRLGEIEFIAEYLAPLAKTGGSFGLKDDAALIPPCAAGLVVTADAIVAGVHFFEADDPAAVAYKALAVNVSDLAAKAAKPRFWVLTLGLPEAPAEEWAARLISGLARAQERFDIALLGGDTVSTGGAFWMSVTALGEPSPRGIVPRGGARAGDYLYVSGSIGDSALGLRLRRDAGRLGEVLSAEHRQFLLDRYLYPEPRCGLAAALAECASAAMDVSDGLALDLSRLCGASRASARVHADRVPLSEAGKTALQAEPALFDAVLTGGDDYEILSAVPPRLAERFEASGVQVNVPVTRIGEITEGSKPPQFLDPNGRELRLSAPGFEHFKP